MIETKIPVIQYTIAVKAASYANAKNATCAIDPATLLLLANIMVNLIRLLFTCIKEKSVVKMIRKPGRIQRYLLYREVKKNFPHEQRKAVYEGLLDTCVGLSEKEAEELVLSV